MSDRVNGDGLPFLHMGAARRLWAAWTDGRLSSRALHVGLALAALADGATGEVRASRGALGKLARLGGSSVSAALGELAERGIIERHEQPGRPNRYFFFLGGAAMCDVSREGEDFSPSQGRDPSSPLEDSLPAHWKTPSKILEDPLPARWSPSRTRDCQRNLKDSNRGAPECASANREKGGALPNELLLSVFDFFGERAAEAVEVVEAEREAIAARAEAEGIAIEAYIRRAAELLRERVKRGRAGNPPGLLREALRKGWRPSAPPAPRGPALKWLTPRPSSAGESAEKMEEERRRNDEAMRIAEEAARRRAEEQRRRAEERLAALKEEVAELDARLAAAAWPRKELAGWVERLRGAEVARLVASGEVSEAEARGLVCVDSGRLEEFFSDERPIIAALADVTGEDAAACVGRVVEGVARRIESGATKTAWALAREELEMLVEEALDGAAEEARSKLLRAKQDAGRLQAAREQLPKIQDEIRRLARAVAEAAGE